MYIFKKDSNNLSTCTAADGCAAAWPPVPGGATTSTDPAVQTAMLGTITRSDDRTQLTYNGMPLYYYEDDKRPGDTTGQDKLEFGGKWYLVSPAGGRQDGKAPASKGM